VKFIVYVLLNVVWCSAAVCLVCWTNASITGACAVIGQMGCEWSYTLCVT